MKLRIPEHLLSINPYVAGKPLEELEREYGISGSVKLASNENPLGPSPKAIRAIEKALEKLHRYPDSNGYYLIKKLCASLNVGPENIVLGNGSDDIIGLVAHACLQPGDEAILPEPSFLMYTIEITGTGATPIFVPLKSLRIDLDGILDRITPKTRLIFLCNPHNPTGTIILKHEFERFLEKVPPETAVIIDEAYIEFVRDRDCLNSVDYLDSENALIILRTFSKAYGLAGLRVGYGIMPPEISNLLNRIRQPFNTGTLAQIGAMAALDDLHFVQKTREITHSGLDFLYGALEKMSLRYFPTHANFFLIDVGRDADEIFKRMLQEGVIVRSMTSYGYPQYIRINVGLPEENERFIKALKKII